MSIESSSIDSCSVCVLLQSISVYWCVFTSTFCLLRIMHDEVSETENIRKNLAIERMIVDGCEVLLDTSQTFVRQGLFYRERKVKNMNSQPFQSEII